MAILSISRIQHRHGLQENLPQLSSAEFGWSVDQRRLFIGNGTIEEGAPSIGNTEILTQYSDMFSLSGSYLFKGEEAGYTVQTGPSSLSTVERSLQHKLDDIVNGKDFGITGDGITNDVDAINHAIVQLHRESVLLSDPRVRRTLHLSAGTYLLSGDYIRLLPFVKIVGDGKFATIITQTDFTQPCVMRTEALVGVQAGRNLVSNLALVNKTDNDILLIDSADTVKLSGVRFKGSIAEAAQIVDSGSSKSCILFAATASTEPSSKIFIEDCTFSEQDYAIFVSKPANNVVVFACDFSHCYIGVSVGDINEDIDGFRVTHSRFNNIYSAAFQGLNGVANLTSAFNRYTTCGNGVGSTAISPIVSFSGDNCYSVGDTFDRLESSVIPPINLSGKQSFATLPNGKIQLGLLRTVGGRRYYLADAMFTPTTAGILSTFATNTVFDYEITREDSIRNGTIKVVGTNLADLVYDDSYIETEDVGVVLYPRFNVNGGIDLTYTSTARPGIPEISLKITSNSL